MKIYQIARKIETQEEYFNSPEFAEVYKGYENNIPMRKSVAQHFNFIAGYVVNVDPETNYDRSFILFKHYQDREEGVKHLKEETLHSCLSNGALYPATITDSMIMLEEELGYRKSKEARKFLAERNITVY